MKLFALLIGLTLLSSRVYAYWEQSSIVECSTFTDKNKSTFDVCAILTFQTPSPSMDGTYSGGYMDEYTIVEGLKEGADTCPLSESERESSFGNGVTVTVERDDNDKCKVSVKTKAGVNTCAACTFCGNELYSADCSNLPHGRNVTCESTGVGDVYFPFYSAALDDVVATTTKAPLATKAPAPKPVARAPANAPKPLIRVPVAVPKQQVVKAPVKAAPVKAPRRIAPTAPVKAPRRIAPVQAPKRRVPTKAPAKAAATSPQQRIRAPVKAPVKAASAVSPKLADIFKRAPAQAPKLKVPSKRS